MNLRRLSAVISIVIVGAVWGGAYLKWGRLTAEELAAEQEATEEQLKKEVDELKGEVLGKDDKTRGKKIVAPQVRPPKAYYDYTPREVCVQMKMRDPDRYEDMDCASDKFSSPVGWIWTSEGGSR